MNIQQTIELLEWVNDQKMELHSILLINGECRINQANGTVITLTLIEGYPFIHSMADKEFIAASDYLW